MKEGWLRYFAYKGGLSWLKMIGQVSSCFLELRQYQRAMREDNEDIVNKISDFWTRQEARSESRASAKSRQSSANVKWSLSISSLLDNFSNRTGLWTRIKKPSIYDDFDLNHCNQLLFKNYFKTQKTAIFGQKTRSLTILRENWNFL